MSLLLDALKKAALEKQRREQPGREQSAGRSQPASHAQSLAAPIVSSVTLVSVAEPSVDPVVEPVSETHLETVAESGVDIVTEEESSGLIFDINEIDHEYLVPVSDSAIGSTDKPSESLTLVSVVADIPEIQEATTQSLIPQPLTTQPVSLQPISPQPLSPQPSGPELLTPAPVARELASELPTPEPAIPVLNAPEQNTIKSENKVPQEASQFHEAPVEQFNAAAGKAALTQLLARSKTATNHARKRTLIMYALLTFTAVAVLVFYFYLLQSNSVSDVALQPPMAVDNQPEEVMPSASDTAVPDPAVATAAVTTAAVPTEVAPVDGSLNTGASETQVQEGTLGVAVAPSAKQAKTDQANPDQTKRVLASQPNSESGSNQQAPQIAKADEAHNSIKLPPEFQTKQGVIAYQKSVDETVSEAIDRGYQAYQRGDFTSAGVAYREALEDDPHQRDALLGAAAVAVREGRQQDALSFYQQRLARDPKDEYAQAGILALSANGEENLPLESELTRLLREFPNAAHLHFLQGSLYAARQQWEPAQLAFFEAWQRDTKNPDLAFNLAVALDHLNQPKEAVRFYQQALTLSSTYPSSFSRAAIDRRLKELNSKELQGTAAEQQGDQP